MRLATDQVDPGDLQPDTSPFRSAESSGVSVRHEFSPDGDLSLQWSSSGMTFAQARDTGAVVPARPVGLCAAGLRGNHLTGTAVMRCDVRDRNNPFRSNSCTT